MLPGVDMTEMQTRSKSDLFTLTGPITYQGRESAEHDIAVLRDALQGQLVADAFVTAVTPAITRKDRGILDFYPSQPRTCMRWRTRCTTNTSSSPTRG